MKDLELKKSWALRHGLRESTGHPCLARLVGKTCWIYRDARYQRKCEELECDAPQADHTSMWIKDGRPAAYVMQPYQYGSASIDWVLAFCKTYRLELRVSTDDSWHFPGMTTLFVIARRGMLQPKKKVVAG